MLTGRQIFRLLVKGYRNILKKKEKEGIKEVSKPIPVVAKPPEKPLEVTGALRLIPPEEKKPEGIEIPEKRGKIKKTALVEGKEITTFTTTYPLIPEKPKKNEPIFAYAQIAWNDKLGSYQYTVVEPQLSTRLKGLFRKLKRLLEEKLDVDLTKLKESEAKDYLHEQTFKLLDYFGITLSEEEKKILSYYIDRDFLGLGPIEPLMHDPEIEDISCDGVGIPIYVFHRNPILGSMPTNIVFNNPMELDNFLVRLAQVCGQSISVTDPLLDGTLPDGSRVQGTLATDIARRGSNFTIRKFTKFPFTPTHILNYGTADVKLMAYLWFCVDYGCSVLVSGGTAVGKTVFLNVLSLFIKPEMKIVSIEDSVTGDCRVWVYRNGRLELVEIGKLFEEEAEKAGKKMILGREYCEPKNLQVLSLNKNNQMVITPVAKLIRHNVGKNVYEITTLTGRKIKVTEDHSLFSLDEDGRIVPVRVKELKEGDFLATPRLIPYYGRGIDGINLLDHLDELRGTFIKSTTIGRIIETHEDEMIRIAKKIGRWHLKTTIQYWKKNDILPTEILREFLKDKKLKINVKNLKIKGRGRSKSLPVFIEFNDDLMTFLGLWLAEGSYDKNSVIISNSSERCREIVRRVARSLGLQTKKHSDGISILLHSSLLKIIMRDILGLKGNAYTKRIPDWMFSLSNEQLSCLLRGYFSGDGSVAKHEIECSSCSANLIQDLQSLLLRFGIIARTSWRREKDGTYKLRISDVKMLRKFKDEINFLQEEKRNKLQTISERRIHEVSDVIPLPKKFYPILKKLLRDEVGVTRSYKGWKSWHRRYVVGGSNISRSFLQRLTARLERNGGYPEEISKLAFSEIFWDRVKEVKKLPKKGMTVYDISVPSLENFVCNNFIAHNTAELRLPHPHWVPHVARVPIATEEGRRRGEIDLFDLLKESLRQRPDYIIVGEVRGKEAYVLFQQMATGHPSLATIHADTLEKLVNRLITPPIDLPPSLLENLDLIVFLTKMKYKGRYVRKVKSVYEVLGYDTKEKRLKTNLVFEWNPMKDKFIIKDKSFILKKISDKTGIPPERIKEELKRRMAVLEWIQENNITDYRDFAKILNLYYDFPDAVLDVITGGA